MKIHELIKALNENRFDPLLITDPFVFVQLYQNRILIEYIADHPHGIDLLVKTINRFTDMIVDLPYEENITYKKILNKTILFLCEKMASDETINRTQFIDEILSPMYHRFMNSLSDYEQLNYFFHPVAYFNFLPELHSRFSFLFESPILHHFRYFCLSADLKKIIQGSDAMNEIKWNDLKNKLNEMADHSLYSIIQTDTWMKWMPWAKTHTSYQLSSYANIISLGRKTNYAEFNNLQKLSSIELLMLLYHEGSDELQMDIAAHIDRLLEERPQDLLLHQILLITIAPPPLGRAIQKLRANGLELISRLNAESVLMLLGAVRLFLSAEDDKNMCRLMLSIKERHSLVDMKFTLKSKASQWLAYIFALANTFPILKKVHITLDTNTKYDDRLLLSLMGADKLVLELSHDTIKHIYDHDFYQVFSRHPPQFQIHILDGSYLVGLVEPLSLILPSLKCGIRQIRLFNDPFESPVFTFEHYKKFLLDKDDQFYLLFTHSEKKSRDVICDVIIGHNSVQPGPVSLSSKESMKQFTLKLIQYACTYPNPQNLYNYQLQPYLVGLFPFIQLKIDLQKRLLQDASSDYIWVLVGKNIRGDGDFYFDSHIYSKHIEFGPLTRWNDSAKKLARQIFPNEIRDTPSSLFMLSAQKFLTTSQKQENIAEHIQDQLNEIKTLGMLKEDNPFKLRL